MWQEIDQHLIRDFIFQDFIEAFGFLSQVALLAEKYDHHPTITNIYNRVTLSFTTHDAGNIVTEKDREIAKIIDSLL